MCLTAHYIDEEWRLNKKIINFFPINDHTGRGLGMVIEMCLIDWGIEKIFSITVDNALCNNVAINYLREKIINWGFSIAHGKYIHIRCIAHIINLIVNDGLKEISRSVSKICHSIRYIRQSPSRLKRFKECVELEKIQSKNLLCLDVCTRWNSTYLMLDVAQKFERAFDRYKVLDPNFCYELMKEDGSDGVPNIRDWEDARRAIKFLENFYDLTLKVSSSLYVTSHILFDEITIVDKLLTKLEKSEDFDLSMMAHAMRDKFEKYWGDTSKTNKLIYIGAILDLRLKLQYVEGELYSLYGNEKGAAVCKEVKTALFEMFNEYKRYNASTKGPHTAENAQAEITLEDSSGNENFRGADMRKRRQKLKRCKTDFEGVDSITELNKYLSEECDDDYDEFDILSWWKVNSLRFPVLSQMSKDVLAVPISTVPSELAFSTGNRVLDQFRSSLSSKLVEALICGQDWFRRSPNPINIEETLEDIDKFESELSNML